MTVCYFCAQPTEDCFGFPMDVRPNAVVEQVCRICTVKLTRHRTFLRSLDRDFKQIDYPCLAFPDSPPASPLKG